MFTLFWRTIKDKKWMIIIYSLAGILFLWLYIALFPSISKSFGQLESYFATVPKGFLKAFGFDPNTFVTFEGYIGSEQFSFVWPIMAIALTISLAGNAIASEIEKGTVEALLAQPLSRLKIFFAKYLAGVFALAIFTLVSVGSTFPLAKVYDITIKSENFFKIGGLGFVFGLAVFSIAMLFSVIFSEKGKANFVPAGILVLMYVLNILSGIKESLDKLKYASFFHYFNPSRVLVYGEIEKYSWTIFLSVFAVATLMAAIWFEKRDIAV